MSFRPRYFGQTMLPLWACVPSTWNRGRLVQIVCKVLSYSVTDHMYPNCLLSRPWSSCSYFSFTCYNWAGSIPGPRDTVETYHSASAEWACGREGLVLGEHGTCEVSGCPNFRRSLSSSEKEKVDMENQTGSCCVLKERVRLQIYRAPEGLLWEAALWLKSVNHQAPSSVLCRQWTHIQVIHEENLCSFPCL